MLTVRDSRRGRSKSPSGRERSRDRSRETRERDHSAVREKKSKKYYESDSESDHRRKKSSSKKHDDSESDGRAASGRHKKSSKRYDDVSESDESDRRGSRKKQTKRYSDSEEDERTRRHDKEKKSSRRHYDEESSESDHRGKGKKTSRKSRRESESSSGDSDRRHGRSHHDSRHPSYAQAQPYAYAPQPPAAGQYLPPQQNASDYHSTRHMSYVDPKYPHPPWPENGQHGYPAQPPPPRYPTTIHQQVQHTPGAFPSEHSHGHTDVPDHHRTHSISSPTPQFYQQAPQYQYAKIEPANVKYKSKNEKDYHMSPDPIYKKQYTSSHDPSFVEVKPAKSDRHGRHEKSKYGSPPNDHLVTRMGHLAVGAGAGALTVAGLEHDHGHGHGHDKPPASPLLEAYHGTYQSISPMPSPFMIGGKDDSDLSDLELEHKHSRSDSDSDSEHRHGHSKKSTTTLVKTSSHEKHSRPKPGSRHDSGTAVMVVSPTTTKKRVSFYDPTPDAKALAAALNHSRVDSKPLIRILPHLSAEDIIVLRNEYKNHVKVGGKGINIAKHIKAKVPGHLGKAAYATALGRWESEANWANVWYNGSAARNELLIESLVGRSNQEIREIKNSFKDKRYNDDLEKCMKAELKADKFRTAILLALEERRMSESQPPELERVRRDVDDLHRALISRDGGETAMIQIIIVRSDAHLREVMRMYEGMHKRNFAREMIAKSRNLVVRFTSLAFFLFPLPHPTIPLRPSPKNSLTPLPSTRAKPSRTSSTAPSTPPCATPSSSTKPSSRRPPAATAPSCSSPASCACTGTRGSWHG